MLTHAKNSRAFFRLADPCMVSAVPYPQKLETQGSRWRPIIHAQALEAVTDAFEEAGHTVSNLKVSLTKDLRGMVATGRLSDPNGLLKPFQGRGLDQSLGFTLLNDNSSRSSLRMEAGVEILVCSNGMTVPHTFGDGLRRKHTAGVCLRELAGAAVYSWREGLGPQLAVQERLLNTEMSPARARRWFFSLAGDNVIPDRYLVDAMRHYAEPPHTEFREPTAWHTYQAVNEALKAAPVASQLDYLRASVVHLDNWVLS